MIYHNHIICRMESTGVEEGRETGRDADGDVQLVRFKATTLQKITITCTSLAHCWWCWPDSVSGRRGTQITGKTVKMDSKAAAERVNIHGVNTAVSAGKKMKLWKVYRSLEGKLFLLLVWLFPLISSLHFPFIPLLMCTSWLTFWEPSGEMKVRAQTDAWPRQTGVKIFFLLSLFLATELFYQHKHMTSGQEKHARSARSGCLRSACHAQKYDGWVPNKKQVWGASSRESRSRWWMNRSAATAHRTGKTTHTPQNVKKGNSSLKTHTMSSRGRRVEWAVTSAKMSLPLGRL